VRYSRQKEAAGVKPAKLKVWLQKAPGDLPRTKKSGTRRKGKQMKKAIILGCLVLAVLCIAGCGNTVAGTYKGNNGTILVIGNNGFAQWTFPPKVTGNKVPIISSYIHYRVKGDVLSIVPNGTDSRGKTVKLSFNFKIQGNKLISLDDNGRATKDVYTKQ
jgi:hypothetical protein